MNGSTLIVTVITLAGLLVGCGARPTDSPSLQDTRWVLVTFGEAPPLTGTAPSAEFCGGQIRGSAGCNTYSGAYTVSESDIAIGDIASTEMWCMEPEGVMDQEQAFLAALASVTSHRLAGPQLEFLDPAGRVLLTFEPQPSAP
jgi:heat shock protein HslJ